MIYKQGLYSNPRNFAGIPAPLSDYEFSRVVVLPVPYDSTTEWHSGARNGPASIIESSYYLEWYDLELHRETHLLGIHTMPELEPAFNCPEAMIQRVYSAAGGILKDSKFLVTLGGEHSISLGCIHAYADKYPELSVLQMDAHSDLRDEYLGTKYGHACVMRRAVDLCPITQVGIRAMSLEEKEFALSKGLSPYFFDRGGLTLPAEQIVGSLKDKVYVTVDLDVFDPSIMSAVGTPEPGGISWYQALDLLKTVSEQKQIVGFDIVELSPNQGPAACSFLAAKLAYKLIGYSIPGE